MTPRVKKKILVAFDKFYAATADERRRDDKQRVWTVATDENKHCGHVHRTERGARVCLQRLSPGATGAESDEFHLYAGYPEDQDDPKWMGARPRVRGMVD